MPPARRTPQRARKAFGSGDDGVPLAAEAAALGAGKAFALAAALARLFFDMEETQSAGELAAIRINGAGFARLKPSRYETFKLRLIGQRSLQEDALPRC